MRWPNVVRRTARQSRRRLRLEPLEDRRLMACLAIGVTLNDLAPEDNSQCVVVNPPQSPDPPAINVGKVGGQFTLKVQVRDVRTAVETSAGVIALPLDISWDRGEISFDGDLSPNTLDPAPPPSVPCNPLAPLNPIVTNCFPLQRALGINSSDVEENLKGLRGASLPAAGQGMEIGKGVEEPFSELLFKSNVAGETTFTVQLAGSMSFADAAVLQRVVRASNTTDNFDDNITVQARLQVDPVVISGTKFNDVNNNGMRDAGEPGLGNWTIRLIQDQNSNGELDASDPVIATTTTGPDGSYQLSVNDTQTYFIREVQQAGFQQTTPNPSAFTATGEDMAGVDFGNWFVPISAENSIAGFVFADTNLNGTFDSGEDGLPNVTVQLVKTDGGNAPPVNALTGPDGWYHFEDLAFGIYNVIEIQPAGFVNASISQGLVFPTGSMLPNDTLRGTTDGFNAFRGINLSAGGNAIDFNFGDNIIPTKRRFVTSVDPFAETCSALGLSCVTVRGTAGNDQIDFVPDTDAVSVTVNNQPAQVFSRDTVNIVKIDALAGDDTVTLLGSSAVDVAHSQSNSCTIQTGAYRAGDYAVLAVNTERTIVDGGLGDDLAVLRDSAVDDVLTAMNEPFIGPVTELESALNMTRFVRAIAFERTRAVSIPLRGRDTATLNGLPLELVGDWLVAGQP